MGYINDHAQLNPIQHINMNKKENSKKDTLRRLRITEGHLKKIIQMVEEDEYCIDIIQQISAVRNSLKRVEELTLDNHLHSCVVKAIKTDKSETAIQELLLIFKKSNK